MIPFTIYPEQVVSAVVYIYTQTTKTVSADSICTLVYTYVCSNNNQKETEEIKGKQKDITIFITNLKTEISTKHFM